MNSIKNTDLKDKRVIVRVDFNVPMVNGKVFDSSKIKAHLETINLALEKGAKIILMSHLGRPKGKKVKELSLKPIAKALEQLLDKKIEFSPKNWGKELEDKTQKMKPGEILLLENLRYEEGEEMNDHIFAERLSRLGDIFIQDAFAVSHRASASTVTLPKILPSFSGLLLEKEVEGLDKIILNPKKPFVCIIGGAKVSTKIDVLKVLIKKADVIIIGGGMANTFLAAEGYEIGDSLVEKDFIDEADDILREAFDNGVEFLLPDDVLVAKKIQENAETKIKDISDISAKEIIVDIGPKSVAKFSEPIKFAGTIFWNGPMGITEIKAFSKDTTAIAKLIVESGAQTVAGGGDTLALIEEYKDKFTFVSTGGGATMEYISHDGKLPGIEALN